MRHVPVSRLLMPLALAVVTLLPMQALPALSAQRERVITMTGEASAAAVPNIAMVQAGTATQARTAKEALEINNKIMTRALAALKEAGIAEKDITTAQLTVQPQIEYKSAATPRVYAYLASHRLSVKLRDVTKLGETIDRLTEAGINSIDQIGFEVENWSAKLDDTRKEAIIDARRKASLMAEAAGAKLGKVLQINVEGGERPMPRMEAVMRAAPAPMAVATPVANGEQNLRLQVSVTWELVD